MELYEECETCEEGLKDNYQTVGKCLVCLIREFNGSEAKDS